MLAGGGCQALRLRAASIRTAVSHATHTHPKPQITPKHNPEDRESSKKRHEANSSNNNDIQKTKNPKTYDGYVVAGDSKD